MLFRIAISFISVLMYRVENTKIITATVVALGVLMSAVQANDLVISHGSSQGFNLQNLQDALKEKCRDELKLGELETAQRVQLLNQLAEFEFGRFLLQNRGINGYWTAYMILHGPAKNDLHPLEEWILHKAPTILATQERFRIFQKEAQKRLKSGMKIASVPCGAMDDLLTLDFNQVEKVELLGIDIDPESTTLALENAKEKGMLNVSVEKRDAFDLGLKDAFDIITSNGLNIYEPDDARTSRLYEEFYRALKPKGVLITSFLTPPPMFSDHSPWVDFDPADAMKQKVIFADVIGAKWQVFRTEEQIREQLIRAGFASVEIIYDRQKMFPTVVATK